MVLKVARGGANWVVLPLVVAILVLSLAGPLGRPWLVSWSLAPFSFALAMMMFFRDPERLVADGMVSPADGKVVRLDQVDDADLGPCDRIAIFMSPLDVHVNRMPVEADVRRVTHTPGKHVPAFDKDSDRNERVTTHLAVDGLAIKVVQIAGAVARRIQSYVEPGDHVAKGHRLGLIKLGSRCDVLVPAGHVRWTVAEGDRVRAAATQIGVLS